MGISVLSDASAVLRWGPVMAARGPATPCHLGGPGTHEAVQSPRETSPSAPGGLGDQLTPSSAPRPPPAATCGAPSASTRDLTGRVTSPVCGSTSSSVTGGRGRALRAGPRTQEAPSERAALAHSGSDQAQGKHGAAFHRQRALLLEGPSGSFRKYMEGVCPRGLACWMSNQAMARASCSSCGAVPTMTVTEKRGPAARGGFHISR